MERHVRTQTESRLLASGVYQIDREGLILHLRGVVKELLSRRELVIFAKTNLMTNNEDKFTKQLGEICLYRFLTDLVINKRLPNCPTFFYDKPCPFDNDTSSSVGRVITEYFPEFLEKHDRNTFDENYIFGIHLMLTEFMKNSVPLSKFLSSMLPELGDGERIFYQIIFQYYYTINTFRNLGLVHNDLHLGNIMIEELESPVTLYYLVETGNDNEYKVFELTTKYFVKIYDFDRSYIYEDDAVGPELKEIGRAHV